jgi:predicted nucleic acid-binding protein
LELIGSIDILRQAKAQGVITNLKESLDALIAGGFWVSRELYSRILQISEEE